MGSVASSHLERVGPQVRRPLLQLLRVDAQLRRQDRRLIAVQLGQLLSILASRLALAHLGRAPVQ